MLLDPEKPETQPSRNHLHLITKIMHKKQREKTDATRGVPPHLAFGRSFGISYCHPIIFYLNPVKLKIPYKIPDIVHTISKLSGENEAK